MGYLFDNLLDKADRWYFWVGVQGLLYAQRRNYSPPVTVRAETVPALRREIEKEENPDST